MNLVLLAACLVAWLPVAVWLFRFWFDDLETFVHQLGWRPDESLWFLWFRYEVWGEWAMAKFLVGVVALYAIGVGLSYVTVARWLAA